MGLVETLLRERRVGRYPFLMSPSLGVLMARKYAWYEEQPSKREIWYRWAFEGGSHGIGMIRSGMSDASFLAMHENDNPPSEYEIIDTPADRRTYAMRDGEIRSQHFA